MKKIKLDKYEQGLEDAIKRGKFVSEPNLAKTKKMFAAAANNYMELKKTKRITIRVKHEDLILVKAKAKRNNVPYQTLLNTLIRQFADGRMSIEI